MGNVIAFRKRRARPSAGRESKARLRRQSFTLRNGLVAASLMLVAAIAGFVFSAYGGRSGDTPLLVAAAPSASAMRGEINAARHFSICAGGSRLNCVVDGDTFYLDGVKIRVADIDTPETGQPKCRQEAQLGIRATRRFQELLNDGPIVLAAIERDADRYGRKLRTIHRDGRSLGDQLVEEGLAHRWIGRKQSWCG